MAFTIAVTGKGGTGKSTVSACLVRILRDRDVHPIFAVDADPNSSLAPLLGLPEGVTISDVRQEIMDAKDEVTGVAKTRVLDMKVGECIREAKGFDMLTMGRPEGASCYCYVNNLVRHALKKLRSQYKVTLVDNEAGMEHLSRMNTDSIDCLLLVCEPTMTSARAAARIMELGDTLPVEVKRKVLVWNKVKPEGVPEQVKIPLKDLSFDAEVVLPADERVARLSAFEESVMSSEIPEEFTMLAGACLADSSMAV
ncbi:carbon monoxide dehydrogenase [Candidatus Hydrogenedentota bacterium]